MLHTIVFWSMYTISAYLTMFTSTYWVNSEYKFGFEKLSFTKRTWYVIIIFGAFTPFINTLMATIFWSLKWRNRIE